MNKTNRKKYDIFIGSSREFIVPYIAQGLLDNFEDNFFDTQLKKEDFFPFFLELSNINGKSLLNQKLLSRSFQTWSMEKYGKIPSLIRNYDLGLSPEWKTIFTSVSDATTLPIYKDWAKFDKLLQREVQNCIIGKQSVRVTVQKLSTELAKLINPPDLIEPSN